MGSISIVLEHVGINTFSKLFWCVVLVNIGVIIFQCPEETLGPDIIQSLTLTIHRDPNVMSFKQGNVLLVRKVTALITIDDLWLAVA